jgi:major intracellular serine protease
VQRDGISTIIEISIPGAYQEEVEQSRLPLRFNNTNRKVNSAAPSEQLMSHLSGKLQTALSDTSMDVPHVSGALAYLIEK